MVKEPRQTFQEQFYAFFAAAEKAPTTVCGVGFLCYVSRVRDYMVRLTRKEWPYTRCPSIPAVRFVSYPVPGANIRGRAQLKETRQISRIVRSIRLASLVSSFGRLLIYTDHPGARSRWNKVVRAKCSLTTRDRARAVSLSGARELVPIHTRNKYPVRNLSLFALLYRRTRLMSLYGSWGTFVIFVVHTFTIARLFCYQWSSRMKVIDESVQSILYL